MRIRITITDAGIFRNYRYDFLLNDMKTERRESNVVIVGGGASGLMAAAALAGRGRSVALLEKQSRVGRKLLSTGNGRCNLTHRGARASDYHGGRQAVQAALKRNRAVKSFRNGTFGEGEMGVTVVELR